MTKQFHLLGRGFSGRGIRVTPLDPAVAESNLLAAAKMAGAEATGLEIKKTEWRIGIKQFITEFSDSCADCLAADVKWRKPKPGELDDLGVYFTPKDVQALESIFRDYHEVMPSEIESIVGKAIDLSEA